MCTMSLSHKKQFHFYKNNFHYHLKQFSLSSQFFYLYFLVQLLKINKKVMTENSFLEHIFDIISISVCGLASKNKRTFWTQTRANRKSSWRSQQLQFKSFEVAVGGQLKQLSANFKHRYITFSFTSSSLYT